jgi:hypothetical protein
MTDVKPSPTVLDVVLALRRSWVAVAFVVLAAALAAYVVADRAEPTFTASAELSVGDGSAVGVFGQPVPGAAIGAKELELLVESPAVRAAAVEALGLPLEAGDGVVALVPDERSGSSVLLRATAADAATAVELVNQVAASTIAAHEASITTALGEAVAALTASATSRQAEIATLETALLTAADAERVSLESSLAIAVDAERQVRRRADELEVEAAAVRSPASVAVEAVGAARGGPPKPRDLAVLAVILAILLCAVVAYLRIAFALARTTTAQPEPRVAGVAAAPDAEDERGRPWGRRDIG